MKSYARLLALTLAVLMVVTVFAGCAPADEDTDPSTSDPSTSVTDPSTTDPSTTDPSVTDPSVTDPSVTDPSVTDPELTPGATATPEPTLPPGVTATPKPTATKKPTAKPTATTKPGTSYAAEPKANLGGFKLLVKSDYFGVLLAKGADEYTNELVDRLKEVQTRMNFTLVNSKVEGDYLSYNSLKKAVLAGDKNIGYFYRTTLPLAMAAMAGGYVVDLSTISKTATGFDYTDPDRFYVPITKLANLDGKQYGVAFMTQSANFTPQSSGIYYWFAKDVLSKNGITAASVYKLVREYKWTWAECQAIMEKCYEPDSDGNGEPEVWGCLSYTRQHKYWLNTNNSFVISKVNGKYVYTGNSANTVAALEWVRSMFLDKKLHLATGSGNLRTYVTNGKTAFIQAAPDYITRTDFDISKYKAKVGLLPAPIGPEQAKLKKYFNPCSNAAVYVMPATCTGDNRVKAATAFAAIGKSLNDIDEMVTYLQEKSLLNTSDDKDMLLNYIIKPLGFDVGYITEIFGTSNMDPVAVMVNSDVLSGNKTAKSALDGFESACNGYIKSILKQ